MYFLFSILHRRSKRSRISRRRFIQSFPNKCQHRLSLAGQPVLAYVYQFVNIWAASVVADAAHMFASSYYFLIKISDFNQKDTA